jgi:hypothetical protein
VRSHAYSARLGSQGRIHSQPSIRHVCLEIAASPWPNSYSGPRCPWLRSTYRCRYGEPNESPPAVPHAWAFWKTVSTTAAYTTALFIISWPMALLNPAALRLQSPFFYCPSYGHHVYLCASEQQGNRCLVPSGLCPHGGLYDRPQELILYNRRRPAVQDFFSIHTTHYKTRQTQPHIHRLPRFRFQQFTLIRLPLHPRLPTPQPP